MSKICLYLSKYRYGPHYSIIEQQSVCKQMFVVDALTFEEKDVGWGYTLTCKWYFLNKNV